MPALPVAVVVDASVALSWILPDENAPTALALRDVVRNDPHAVLAVPPTFWYEIGNALWVAVRRRRLNPDQAAAALTALQAFDFDVWTIEAAQCLRAALEYDLSVYDAVYLALAEDGECPLWTVDRGLAVAARAAGLAVAPG